MKINTTCVLGLVFVATLTQTAMAANSAEELYDKCEARQTTAEQRDCYPAVVKQSEVELAAVEKKVRRALAELENTSEGSRSMHPVKNFDKAKRAYRVFRDAESNRVLSSYGSGNGGGLAAYKVTIEMNLARIKQLKEE